MAISEFLSTWQRARVKPDQRFAVAVSGCAPSIALCSLLLNLVKPTNITAFTVDHNYPGSPRPESQKLEQALQKLGIRHQTLSLSWSNQTPMASWSDLKVQTNARARRYEALSKQCRADGISNLLTGHCLERQVSLSLYRLMRNAGLDGLAGYKLLETEIKSITPDSQHVTLIRPLLGFSRNTLEQVCRDAELPFLKGKDNPYLLPMNQEMEQALDSFTSIQPGVSSRSEVLTELGHFTHRFSQYRQRADQQAKEYLDTSSLRDPPTGTAFLNIESSSFSITRHWISSPILGNRILANLIKWCSPFAVPPPSESVDRVRRAIIQYYIDGSNNIPTISNVFIQPPRPLHTGTYNWIFSRAPFPSKEVHKNTISIKEGDVVLWDSRFYVSIKRVDPDRDFFGVDVGQLTFVVRPFTLADYHDMLSRLSLKKGVDRDEAEQCRNVLNHYMAKMPPAVRWTIPCVALLQDDGSSSYVVSVPSLNVNLEPDLVEVKLSLRSHPAHVRREQEVSFQMNE
ncbi:hypothetical protein BC829DRAFT_435772 [Chytridium lagenaria]|nr:hypothetical protein BC829DRAFT_435772 [Chytridium lagenaria]